MVVSTGAAWKLAVTVLLPSMVTVTGFAVLETLPLQPVKA